MDWHDCCTWWMGKYRPAGLIAFADFFAAFDAWSDGEAVWQAAFDNVLAGVDEELVEAVALVCALARLDNPQNNELYNFATIYACLGD